MNVLAGIRMQGFSQNGGMAFAPAFQQNEVTVPVLIRPEKITLECPVVPLREKSPLQETGGGQQSGPQQSSFKQGRDICGQLSQPWTLPWVTRGSAQNCVQ